MPFAGRRRSGAARKVFERDRPRDRGVRSSCAARVQLVCRVPCAVGGCPSWQAPVVTVTRSSLQSSTDPPPPVAIALFSSSLL